MRARKLGMRIVTTCALFTNTTIQRMLCFLKRALEESCLTISSHIKRCRAFWDRGDPRIGYSSKVNQISNDHTITFFEQIKCTKNIFVIRIWKVRQPTGTWVNTRQNNLNRNWNILKLTLMLIILIIVFIFFFICVQFFESKI